MHDPIKNRLRFILFLSSFIILCSNCTKDKDTEDISSVFIIGEHKDLSNIYFSYDPPKEIIAEWHNSAYEEFSLNYDHVNDIKIISDWVISPGGLSTKNATLKTLNSSVEIAITEVTDTTYRCIVEYGDTIQVHTYYSNDTIYECQGNDSISTTLTTYPRIFNYGDKPDLEIKWKNNSLTLSYFDSSSFGWFENGTLYYQSNIIYRGIWNDMEEKYLLYRYRHNNSWYYGWIKININDFNHIRIHEIAYQLVREQ